MSTGRLADLVHAFSGGPAALREALRGLDAGSMNRRKGDSWSVRDIVIHLSDTEIVRAFRIRHVLAEDRPALAPFDEGRWQRRLQYLWRSPEAALASFEQVVFGTAEILSRFDRAGWERVGMHAELGEISVRELVERGIAHHAEHCQQITALRDQ